MKKSMVTAWIIMFALMFMSAFLTAPLFAILQGGSIDRRTNIPKLTRGNYSVYHTEFEDWFNNILPYRSELIRINSKINLYGFHESPSDEVVIGKNNWLFYKPTMGDYKRTNLYSAEELEELRRILEVNQQYFKERGIEYLIFIAPNKASIYGELYLPDYIGRQGGMSRTEQAVTYLRQNTDVKIVFPQDEMITVARAYPESPLYLHFDTHWNYLGGYYGAQALLREMGISLPQIDEVTVEKNSDPMFYWNSFDLERMIGMEGELPEDINYKISGYSDNVVSWTGDTTQSVKDFHGVCTTTSNAKDSRRVVFVRDSFGTAMMPFLASQFSEIYSPHKAREIDWAVMKPDIVIFETVEREAFDEYLEFNFE